MPLTILGVLAWITNWAGVECPMAKGSRFYIIRFSLGLKCRSLLAGDSLRWHGHLARGFGPWAGRPCHFGNRLQAGSYLRHLCLLLATIILAACVGINADAQTPPSAPIVISAWTHEASTTPEFALLKQAAETFNRRQSTYRVEIYPSFSKDYEQRVLNAAATGTLPSLLELDGPFLYAFAWPGYLQPIDKFVSPELLKDFLPSIIAQGTYEGRLYSLGLFDSGLALWGNRRYLAAAGVRIPSVKAPWSLEEFEQALDRLTKLADVDYALSLTLYVFAGGEFHSYAYAPILQGFGGDVIDRRDYRRATGVLDGPQSVAAMKRVQSWFEKGWTRPVLDRTDDFDTGRTALAWGGHWKYSTYQRALGEDLILLPLPDFGHGIKTGMGSWNWSITSTCRHPDGAWAFLSYLMSTEEILKYTNINGAVPARYSALVLSPNYRANGPLSVFAEQLGAGCGVPRPATPAYYTLRSEFSEAILSIVAGGDVQTALSKAARNFDADVARHRGYPEP